MKALLIFLASLVFLTSSDNHQGQTQSDLNALAKADFTAADKQLSVTYQKLLDTLDARGRKKLIQSENAWVGYREAQAELEADEVRGGTAAPSILDATRAELTRERTERLKKILHKE